MALNYSHMPIFPAHIPEDNMVSPMRIVNGCLVEGIPDKTGEGFIWPRHASWEREEWFECGRERVDSCGLRESASKDIVDLLPSDPFEMGINTYSFEMALRTTFTALRGWLNDLEIDCGRLQNDIVGPIKEDYSFLNGLDFIWDNAMMFSHSSSNDQSDHKLNASCSMNPLPKEVVTGDALVPCFGTTTVCGTRDSSLGFDCEYTDDFIAHMEEEDLSCHYDDNGEAPHEGLFYALGYLGVKDLLSVQMVSKSFRSTVKDDPLLWRNIHIYKPLNERITDDALQLLSSMARGNVRCLSFVDCHLITDDGLRRVLEANPRVTKLCVPGCTRLSINGIMNILEAFNSKQGSRIRHLRVGGLYGMTHEHYERLMTVLRADSLNQKNDHNPHFYSWRSRYRLCDDDRPLDIEPCPKCDQIRLVYHCPSEVCRAKDSSTQECRACIICIPRCIECGKCFDDGPYEETFYLEKVCADCFNRMENQGEGDVGGSHMHLNPCEFSQNICIRG
ncbi:unnamed protein product [Cuscuta campestris]|uniref:F-box domain-containing protein n=1 Tax=Cuscuta campestris TaxID=132261 RepID=A0A484MW86_9ASTE|nr:unnamed protein product [Cuscuta campestris]